MVKETSQDDHNNAASKREEGGGRRPARRQERLMRKENVEKEVSMMIGESALKVEIWMDADRVCIKG